MQSLVLWAMLQAGKGATAGAFSLRLDELGLPERTLPKQAAMVKAGGRNRSPLLTWTNPPGGTRSFLLVMQDRHPVAHDWVHWTAWDIPDKARQLRAGASPLTPPQHEGRNDFGFDGYGGPLPPAGTGPHKYVFTLHALDIGTLGLPDGAQWQALQARMAGHVLGSATSYGYFEADTSRK